MNRTHSPVPSSTFSTSITSVLIRPRNWYLGPSVAALLFFKRLPRNTDVSREVPGSLQGSILYMGYMLPVLLLAVDQQVVKEEEDPLLDVPCWDLQQHALHQHLRTAVCDVRALSKVQRKQALACKKTYSCWSSRGIWLWNCLSALHEDGFYKLCETWLDKAWIGTIKSYSHTALTTTTTVTTSLQECPACCELDRQHQHTTVPRPIYIVCFFPVWKALEVKIVHND